MEARRPIRGWPVVVLGLATVLASACRKGPADLLQLGESLAPFERMPYVQAVDTSSARVLWRARPEVRDSFLYRTERDSVWRAAPVERLPLDSEGPVLDSTMVDRRVHLTGLPTDARVQYTVVADSLEVGPITFRTAPAPGAGGATRLLAFGDSGWGSQGQILLAQVMADMDWDLAVHMGDVAYQQGTEIDFTRRHFDVYRQLLSSVPFFPSPGDHDMRTAGGAPYDRAFVWPAPEEGARYYTFRWGDIQFIALDTSDESAAGRRLRRGSGPQMEWLRETLEALHGDPTLAWTIVFTHAPPYSHATGFGGHGSSLRVRRVVAPLFDRYGVDLVLSGHDHHYERTWPIRDGERVNRGCGPVYVVSGGGGASRYGRAIAPSRVTARTLRAYEFLELVISEGGIRGTAIGTDGETLDRFQVEPWSGSAGDVPRVCE